MADLQLREQVRDRYAAAALAVTAGGTNSDALAAEGCCGSTTADSRRVLLDRVMRTRVRSGR